MAQTTETEIVPATPIALCPTGARAVELESFYRAGRFLSSILDIDELLAAILEEGLDAVGGTRGFVGLVNRSTGELELRITAGQGWDEQPSRSIKITDEPGHGITIWVVCSGVPYVTGDVRRDPHYVMFFPDVRSEIAVPLVNRDGRTIGVINIESEQIDAFSQRDLQLLVALSNQAAIAVSVANYRAREAALIEIGNELASSTDMDELFRRVVRRSAELLRADDCSIFQLNPNTDRLILRASGELLERHVGSHTYQLGEGLTGWVAQHASAARVSDVRADPRWRGLYPELPAEAIEAYLAAPVFHRNSVWGVLRVVRRKPASSIIRNDFTERDETLLTTLARQVGAAITQQSLIKQQLQMERMAAWGEMSARSAHMIGNKVFALKGQLNELEYLARGPELSREAVLDVAERAKQGVFRLEEILTEFRDFLMATHLDRKPTDLSELVRSTVRESFPKEGPVAIDVDTAPGLRQIAADATKLRRAISELLENSVNHQLEGGAIHVRTGPWGAGEREAYPEISFHGPWAQEGGAVRLEVIDHGPGIPPENKRRLFTPFFTTRSKGMGLGLSIVKGIVDAHGGTIAEVGREGEGAHFIIVLPTVETGEPERE
ncbi:MAG TPA: GAF domain-containing sensor histidine kinase [Armatimonadota bacterium]|nr:GAF domain-containing sensor histidine kinase [Armatimonadota bacterium]